MVVARGNWEVQIPWYFLSFSTTFWIFFRLGKPKIFVTICNRTDGNFPIFENSALSSRRKSDLIFPCIFSRIRKLQLYWSTFPKKIVKFPGRQIACIFNKKISFTMFSVRVFLILPSPFKTSRIAVQRPSINLSRRWFNGHHISKK